MSNTPILVITGATASGKTDVSMVCASLLDAEIISADSRQVYRGLDIGTAKPTLAERSAVRHHGIDICDPSELYTAGRFFNDAHRWIEEIQARGKRVIIVGGSGLYVRVLMRGLFEGPAADAALRRELETRLREEGKQALLRDLTERDPEMAAEIDVNNPVRIIRALEVCILSGQAYSRLRKEKLRLSPHRFSSIALAWERSLLHARINVRVDAMMEAGLVDEVRGLLEAGVDPSWNALNTVGYKEISVYLSSLLPIETAVEQIKTNTRRFARRQLTWFRRDAALRWFDADAGFDAEVYARRILAELDFE